MHLGETTYGQAKKTDNNSLYSSAPCSEHLDRVDGTSLARANAALRGLGIGLRPQDSAQRL